jgi:hypothetical protein
MKGVSMININKIKEAFNELFEYSCRVKCSLKIMKSIKGILHCSYELLGENTKAVMQLWLDTFFKILKLHKLQMQYSSNSSEECKKTGTLLKRKFLSLQIYSAKYEY